MRTIALSILLAAGAALAGAAHAQDAPPTSPPDPSFPASLMNVQIHSDPGWDGDAWRNSHHAFPVSHPARNSFWAGFIALEAKDFTQAEEIFGGILRFNKNDIALRYHMGVAKMNLGKWDEAKRYLTTPARKLRKDPDPKSLLGVAYARLGDIDGANAQRADLVKMAEACKGTCKLSSDIVDGIQKIDEALAETPASKSETQS